MGGVFGAIEPLCAVEEITDAYHNYTFTAFPISSSVSSGKENFNISKGTGFSGPYAQGWVARYPSLEANSVGRTTYLA